MVQNLGWLPRCLHTETCSWPVGLDYLQQTGISESARRRCVICPVETVAEQWSQISSFRDVVQSDSLFNHKRSRYSRVMPLDQWYPSLHNARVFRRLFPADFKVWMFFPSEHLVDPLSWIVVVVISGGYYVDYYGIQWNWRHILNDVRYCLKTALILVQHYSGARQLTTACRVPHYRGNEELWSANNHIRMAAKQSLSAYCDRLGLSAHF